MVGTPLTGAELDRTNTLFSAIRSMVEEYYKPGPMTVEMAAVLMKEIGGCVTQYHEKTFG